MENNNFKPFPFEQLKQKKEPEKTAVAIAYEPGEKAPKILATGKGQVAEKIIEKAKESYDRYFKDAPVFPENHEQDVVCNAEEIEKIIDKKKAQLDGHVENLNALKKEIEVTATDKLNKTFTDDAAEYAKKAVNQMLADYEEETNRIADLKKKLAALKK